jgi:hypothetical protein
MPRPARELLELLPLPSSGRRRSTSSSSALGADNGDDWEPVERVTSVLCYGDDLTAGRCEQKRMHPYAVALEDSELVCTAVGACGATAEKLLIQADTPGNFDVLDRRYNGIGVEVRQGHFDLVVIMVGSHDLTIPPEDAEQGRNARGFALATSVYEGGWEKSSPTSIVSSVVGLHECCHAQGVRTVALALPPNANTTMYASDRAAAQADDMGMDEYTWRWREVNRMLGEWAGRSFKDRGSGGQRAGVAAPFPPRPGMVAFLDLVAEYPELQYSNKKDGMWSSKRSDMNMSAKGYGQFARFLRPKLLALLAEAATLPLQPAAGLASVSDPQPVLEPEPEPEPIGPDVSAGGLPGSGSGSGSRQRQRQQAAATGRRGSLGGCASGRCR